MAKLYTGSIDVTKINKDKLFKGQKGTYLNVSIWINDEPDQYGNQISIQQQTAKDEPKIYIGNAKEFVSQTQTQESPQLDQSQQDPSDDLPF